MDLRTSTVTYTLVTNGDPKYQTVTFTLGEGAPALDVFDTAVAALVASLNEGAPGLVWHVARSVTAVSVADETVWTAPT